MVKPGDKITILVDDEPVETVIDMGGVQRFVANDVVRYLVDRHGEDLNFLPILHAQGKISLGDYRRFYQMMGYSVSGFEEIFGEGSGVADEAEPCVIQNPLWR